MDLKLRDYQEEVLSIINNLEEGAYLIQMATGLRKNGNIYKYKKKRSCTSPSTQRRTSNTTN